MTLIRWQNPQQRVHPADRYLRRVFGEFESALQQGFELGSYSPRVDIAEDEKNFYLHAELPGLSAEDVKLTIADGVLTLRGEKKRESKVEGQNYHRIERSFGEFVRQFTLPEHLSDDVQANVENGVLEVTIAKIEPEKPKEREIKIGSTKPVESVTDQRAN